MLLRRLIAVSVVLVMLSGCRAFLDVLSLNIAGRVAVWYMFGGTYGTVGVPYGGRKEDGNPFYDEMTDPQVTISPSGQLAGTTVKTPGTGTIVQTIYAPDYFTNGILVLSSPSLAQEAVIKPAGQPYDVVISPDQSTLYAAVFPPVSGGNASIAVISTATNAITRSIPLPAGSHPQWEALSPDGATLYVADNAAEWSGMGLNDLLVVDTAGGTVKATIAVPNFINPLGRPVISPDGLSIYQEYAFGFQVIDAMTLQPNGVIDAELNTNAHAVFTPDGRYLYASGYSNIEVIDAATHRFVTNITFPEGSSAMLGDLAMQADGTALLAADLTGTAGNGALYLISTSTNTITQTLPPPSGAPKRSQSMQVILLQ